MGGMNMNNLMKQAQKMQKKMEETQAALAEKTLEVTSGGGAADLPECGKGHRQEAGRDRCSSGEVI